MPHLTIEIAARVRVPADIGIVTAGYAVICLYWLHTHDDSGTIHVEAPGGTFTLADFFAVWVSRFRQLVWVRTPATCAPTSTARPLQVRRRTFRYWTASKLRCGSSERFRVIGSPFVEAARGFPEHPGDRIGHERRFVRRTLPRRKNSLE